LVAFGRFSAGSFERIGDATVIHRKCGNPVRTVTIRETSTTEEVFEADEENDGVFIEVKAMEPISSSRVVVCHACGGELDKDEVETVVNNLHARGV